MGDQARWVLLAAAAVALYWLGEWVVWQAGRRKREAQR